MRPATFAAFLLIFSCAPPAGPPPSATKPAAEKRLFEMSDPLDPVVVADRKSETVPTVEKMVGLSAHQIGLAAHNPTTPMTRNAGVLLARMGVSEAGFGKRAELQMRATLQVAREFARQAFLTNERLLATLSRLSPHVARVKPYTRARQRWTSTLPARGSEAGQYWVECTSHDDAGRSLPVGCSGAWKIYRQRWADLRAYGKELVRKKHFKHPVKGNPIAWGGHMDTWLVIERRPNLCLLESEQMCDIESAAKCNYFYGRRSDPANTCLEIPEQVRKKSKAVSVAIMKRDLKAKSALNRLNQ